MTTLTKNIIATGLSSGLGFEVLRRLLKIEERSKIIFGARVADTTKLKWDIRKFDLDILLHSYVVLPLELNDLVGVKTFAEQALETLEKLGETKIDYLLLNAGMWKQANEWEPYKSKWCEAAMVNHFSHHYLIHLLREKLVASQTRIVVVTCTTVLSVEDTGTSHNTRPTSYNFQFPDQSSVGNIEDYIKAGSGTDGLTVYTYTKFLQLLGAHWWSRQLQDQCRVVAVSPGMIPHTGLGREAGFSVPDIPSMSETIPQGASQILKGLSRDDCPPDPERIFLTSWGSWLERSEVGKALDKGLQEKWCPSKEELEKEAGIAE
ncbi:hypothetical protein E4U57_002265 [Claviceps arundinis]|uniref:Uncharacterized protein n=1 Tax=Claviceps arundinis TaxID=1623583 RepID=A0A9P7SQL9_9HYPO|nr:hypothetical protein E4U57_002265 [Claviceps arundinis]KAG5973325.1 hypothetical protein E4U56_005112 [Claviceps arundinis]